MSTPAPALANLQSARPSALPGAHVRAHARGRGHARGRMRARARARARMRARAFMCACARVFVRIGDASEFEEPDDDGRTPLMMAAYNGKLECVHMLVLKAKVGAPWPRTEWRFWIHAQRCFWYLAEWWEGYILSGGWTTREAFVDRWLLRAEHVLVHARCEDDDFSSDGFT
eukprot:6187422-Pleurochrysis_carterae.AAC.1